MGILIKRSLDVIVAVILLTLFALVVAVIWFAITMTMGPPAVFKQRRPGKNAHVFEVLKFRTMIDARDENGYPLPDYDRTTSLGAFLRCTSLDELPQMINVLKGEMSFVGPRPLLAHYLVGCKKSHVHRYDMRPGITGWAQIQGRKALDYEKRFEYDIWYVDNWSLSLDLKIILRTIIVILKREGIEETGKPVVGIELVENIHSPALSDRPPLDTGKREEVIQMLYERELLERYNCLSSIEEDKIESDDLDKPVRKISAG